MRARVRRDDVHGHWILQFALEDDSGWTTSSGQHPTLVRMSDCKWATDPDARLQGQARVERAWVEGTLVEIGHGECQLESDSRVLCDAQRVRFDWKRTGEFQDHERKPLHMSAAVELRPDGTAWEGPGWFD